MAVLPIAEWNARFEATEELLVKRETTASIERKLCQQFGITKRQAVRWMQRVRERWRNEAALTSDRERKREELEQSLNLVYREALKVGELREANTALKTLAHLHGLMAPKDVTSDGNVTVVFKTQGSGDESK